MKYQIMRNRHVVLSAIALMLAACTGYKPVSEKVLSLDKGRPAACTVIQADAADGGKRREYLRCSAEVVLASAEAQQTIAKTLPLRIEAGGDVVQSGVRIRASANANGNTDETTCRNAFMQGIRKFYKVARKHGGSAVANVRMNADGSGHGEFHCVVGTVRGTVTVYGDIVR